MKNKEQIQILIYEIDALELLQSKYRKSIWLKRLINKLEIAGIELAGILNNRYDSFITIGIFISLYQFKKQKNELYNLIRIYDDLIK